MKKINKTNTLEKTELYNPLTNTTTDTHEIEIALKIVPKNILSFLITHLKPMSAEEQKEFDIPFVEDARINVHKLSNDVYSGEIYKNNKVVYRFKYRPIPSLGLILLSIFELYDLPTLDEDRPEQYNKEIDLNQLSFLVRNIVDQYTKEKETMELLLSIKDLIMQKESNMVEKPLKLKEFLSARKLRSINLSDIEKKDLNCPDCTGNIYKSGDAHIKCCLCFGEFYNANIKFNKSEDGVKLKFPKNFDIENIEMLVETIKNAK